MKAGINIIKKNERTLILDGLAMGDTVVTQPLISVQEGIPVVMIGSEKAKKIAEKLKMKKGPGKGGKEGLMNKK